MGVARESRRNASRIKACIHVVAVTLYAFSSEGGFPEGSNFPLFSTSTYSTNHVAVDQHLSAQAGRKVAKIRAPPALYPQRGVFYPLMLHFSVTKIGVV